MLDLQCLAKMHFLPSADCYNQHMHNVHEVRPLVLVLCTSVQSRHAIVVRMTGRHKVWQLQVLPQSAALHTRTTGVW